jgi:serine/threonine protein kinase
MNVPDGSGRRRQTAGEPVFTGAPPPEVPDLELLRRIGQGGFGEVWLAVNRATGRLRAVKLIPLRGHRADPAGREVVSLAHLEAQLGTRHENLLDIHHVGKTADYLFYIMDPADDVSGGPATAEPDYRPATLARRLEQGPLPTGECRETARQLLAGLAHVHAAGMIHRDVKPANCLWVGRKLKLADFGLLTAANSQASRLGTVKYMPPDGRMDARADVYAAGLVLYELLTGLPAEAFPRLGARAREITADPELARLNRVVLRACQPSPESRFRDAGEMLTALEAPPSRPPRRRLLLAVAVVCLLSLAASASLYFRPQPPRVDVNFISEPFEATIQLDGVELTLPDGTPYRTPCTVRDLPGGRHHVLFKHPERSDYDAGRIDLRKTREITVRWHR